IQVALRRVYSRQTAQVNPFPQASVSFVGRPGFAAAFHRSRCFVKIIVYKNMFCCVLFVVFGFSESEARKALP
ncbi:hypothetical protein, partial [Pseudomonas palleroniana]|uniref:hypothetical protein n=1 Tax=Pseudomonas palleroniana TaxID=191390 RepID=UPI001BB0AE2D